MVRVGGYRHKVSLQNATRSKNSVGEQTETWTTVANQMARIAPVKGRAYFEASGEKADITHEIRTRYNPGITLNFRDRVLFGSRTFEIRSVINDEERNREWILMCREELHTTDG